MFINNELSIDTNKYTVGELSTPLAPPLKNSYPYIQKIVIYSLIIILFIILKVKFYFFHQAKKHIGHIQILSVPKRNEPSNYEFDFLKEILNDDTIKKPLWVGAEYNPKTGYVKDGVDWIKHFK